MNDPLFYVWIVKIPKGTKGLFIRRRYHIYKAQNTNKLLYKYYEKWQQYWG